MGNKFNQFIQRYGVVLIIAAVVIVMNISRSGSFSPLKWIYDTAVILPGIVLGLTLHEAAHAYVSYWLGDPTPKAQNRLSLNPAAHIDPIGLITLLVVHFGWGRPVQVNPRYYKNRRSGEIMVALAGVTMNLIIAIIFAMIFRGIAAFAPSLILNNVGRVVINVVYYAVAINVMLMLFNLLPVPPLDGFNLITQLFGLDKKPWYYTLVSNSMIILLLLIAFRIPSMIISPLMETIVGFLCGIPVSL